MSMIRKQMADHLHVVVGVSTASDEGREGEREDRHPSLRAWVAVFTLSLPPLRGAGKLRVCLPWPSAGDIHSAGRPAPERRGPGCRAQGARRSGPGGMLLAVPRAPLRLLSSKSRFGE